MRILFNRTVLLAQFGVILLTTVGLSGYAWFFAKEELSGQLEVRSQQTAALWAGQIRSHFQFSESWSRSWLESKKTKRLGSDSPVNAVSLFKRVNSEKNWKLIFRSIKKASQTSPKDLERFDRQIESSLFSALGGAHEVHIVSRNDGEPSLRLIFSDRLKEVTVVDLKAPVLWPVSESPSSKEDPLFSFLVNHQGHLLVQTQPDHFRYGERLAHLRILEEAKRTRSPAGQLEYQELPKSPPQRAHFQEVGFAGLTVISQYAEWGASKTLPRFLPGALAIAIGLPFVLLSLLFLVHRALEEARSRRA